MSSVSTVAMVQKRSEDLHSQLQSAQLMDNQDEIARINRQLKALEKFSAFTSALHSSPMPTVKPVVQESTDEKKSSTDKLSQSTPASATSKTGTLEDTPATSVKKRSSNPSFGPISITISQMLDDESVEVMPEPSDSLPELPEQPTPTTIQQTQNEPAKVVHAVATPPPPLKKRSVNISDPVCLCAQPIIRNNEIDYGHRVARYSQASGNILPAASTKK